MNIAGVISNYEEEEVLSKELLSAKFKTFAKEHFQDFVKRDRDYLRYLKNSAQFYSFKFLPEQAEYFIDIETAPSFWLCDSPAILKAEEGLISSTRNIRTNNGGNYKTIKEFYSKWVIIPSPAEKRYYALSAIKLIEKDTNPENFIKHILFAVILGFDKKIYSPEKSFEQFDLALEKIDKWNADEIYKNELRYLINLFTGFIHLNQGKVLEADLNFSEAMGSKPDGITAKFYSALSQKRLGEIPSVIKTLNSVVDYDKSLLQLAVEKNSLLFMNYVIYNAVTYNIFHYSDFADLLIEIDDIIKLASGEDEFNFELLHSILIKLKELKLNEHYTEEIVKHIGFLDRYIEQFHGNKNKIVGFSKSFVKEKLFLITDLIIENINKKYTEEMLSKLTVFDEGINDNLEAIKYLDHEKGELKKTYKRKLEDAQQEVEKKYNYAITSVEERIENLPLEEKFNPQKTFNNTMMYNIIITILVFILGGFSGCYGGSIDDVYNYKDVMGTVMLSGFKWGVITFFIGAIISIFSSVFAYMERATEKQSLIKRISYLKTQKDKENDQMKKEIDRKLKSVSDNFNERITEHEKDIDKLKSEKEEQFKILKEETDKIIQQHTEKLQSVLDIV